MMEYDNWYLKRILMNFNGDKSTYYAVKQIVVNNLLAMGVEASMDDGMTTLANKIKDIEPTIIVDDFDIDLTLSANDTSVYVGDTVVLSAHLTASYDTEDVDLVGDLQNATVSFYENNTLLDTSTTNSDGVATYSYTVVDDTDLSFTARFEGTENFDDAESNTVNVNVSESSGDAVIIQSPDFLYDTQTATVVLNGVESTIVEDGYMRKATFDNVEDGTYSIFYRAYVDGVVWYTKPLTPNTITVDAEHRIFDVRLI